MRRPSTSLKEEDPATDATNIVPSLHQVQQEIWLDGWRLTRSERRRRTKNGLRECTPPPSVTMAATSSCAWQQPHIPPHEHQVVLYWTLTPGERGKMRGLAADAMTQRRRYRGGFL